MEKRIFLSSPHMGESEKDYMVKAFDSNWIAPLGPMVDEFEETVRQYVGVPYSLALSSGTAAIHLALEALKIQQGDVVFCSTLTFVASCNPIVYLGAMPVFIDSEYETWNMCPIALEKAFKDAERMGKLPKAVIVVHLYGQSAKFDEIQSITSKYGVPIIEDAAESLGAMYKGRQTGTLGELGIYSFNGNKIITTSGGGMLISKNKSMIEYAKFLSTQAKESFPYYEHKERGYNYRMSNILAGIGIGQMKVLEKRIQQKKDIYSRYLAAFSDIREIEMLPKRVGNESNYWLSTILLKKDCNFSPRELIDALEAENIESRHVWKPMHIQPYYKDSLFYTNEQVGSVAEDLFHRGLCLPSDTKMTVHEQERVIEIMKNILLKGRDE